MRPLEPTATLALGGLCLFAGYAVRRRLPVLARLNMPAPVIGGLLAAVVRLLWRQAGGTVLQFDTALQGPLMIAFFTSIGLNASFSLLRASGRQVLLFLAMATVLAVLQNVVGIAIARAFGLPPLFGVLAGSATLAGGPATGLAFAPLFERAGVHGAQGAALASAMAGIVCGAVIGAPVATLLIERLGLKHALRPGPTRDSAAAEETPAPAPVVVEGAGLKSLVLILAAMWAGSWVGIGLEALGITLPAYIGAMLVGALIRNLDDRLGWFGLSVRDIDRIGGACLSLFLVVALMDLRLWELAGLALPLLVNLSVQTALAVLFCAWPLLRLMGRDYDAAVMGGGFVGFMLGTTANAMAVMRSLVERYGPAPRAFMVAPLVGAFFIDFTNAIVITLFINGWR